MAVEVFINGKREEVEGPMTVGALLESKRIRPEVVSVAFNREMLKRDQIAEKVADDGDVVEIMIQLAGGSDA
jgi:thiamine biosynthesis protein ThiS